MDIFIRHLKTKNSSKLGATSECLTIAALCTAAFSLLWSFILVVVRLTHFIEIAKSPYRAALIFPQLGAPAGTLPVSGKGWTSHSSPDPDRALCTEKLSACSVWCLHRVYFARQTMFHKRILNVFLGKYFMYL